jgi:hypothetical protein
VINYSCHLHLVVLDQLMDVVCFELTVAFNKASLLLLLYKRALIVKHLELFLYLLILDYCNVIFVLMLLILIRMR